MEFLFELIFELIIEGGIEASKSEKIPKCIRYLLIAIISLFFIAVIGLIFFSGILLLNENILIGMFFILLGIIMLLLSIFKFRKAYLNKMK